MSGPRTRDDAPGGRYDKGMKPVLLAAHLAVPSHAPVPRVVLPVSLTAPSPAPIGVATPGTALAALADAPMPAAATPAAEAAPSKQPWERFFDGTAVPASEKEALRFHRALDKDDVRLHDGTVAGYWQVSRRKSELELDFPLLKDWKERHDAALRRQALKRRFLPWSRGKASGLPAYRTPPADIVMGRGARPGEPEPKVLQVRSRRLVDYADLLMALRTELPQGGAIVLDGMEALSAREREDLMKAIHRGKAVYGVSTGVEMLVTHETVPLKDVRVILRYRDEAAYRQDASSAAREDKLKSLRGREAHGYAMSHEGF